MRRALVLLVLPLALVACGGSSSSSGLKVDPVAYVKHAATRTADTPSERMAVTMTMKVSDASISMAGSGDYSNTAHTGSFAYAMSFPGKSLKFDAIMDGTKVYVSSPALAGKLPAGKTWLELDLAQLGKQAGVDFSSLMSQTPAQALQRLEAAGTVTQVGTETIDGVATTHFQIEHLDLAKIPQGAKLEALAHPTYGPIDVWIGNANGYVYREEVDVTFSAGGQSASETVRADFSRFGEKVHVNAPPARATVNASTLKGFRY